MAQKHVVSSVAHYDDSYLILGFQKGEVTLYDFPGGVKEEDEDPLEGMMREFKEETGLDISDVENVTGMRPYTYSMGDTSFKVYPFDIQLEDQEIEGIDSDEHDIYRWVDSEVMASLTEEGLLNASKYFNCAYIQAGMNDSTELRDNSGRELSFNHEEVSEDIENIERLINSELET